MVQLFKLSLLFSFLIISCKNKKNEINISQTSLNNIGENKCTQKNLNKLVLSDASNKELANTVNSIVRLLKEKNYNGLDEFVHKDLGFIYGTYPGAHQKLNHAISFKNLNYKSIIPKITTEFNSSNPIFIKPTSLETLRLGLDGLFIVGPSKIELGENYYEKFAKENNYKKNTNSKFSKLRKLFLLNKNYTVYPFIYNCKEHGYDQCQPFYLSEIENKFYIVYFSEELGCLS